MSFKEASRSTAHDGSVHIHSEAYEKVKAYLQEYAYIEEIDADIATLRKRRAEIREALTQAEAEMISALRDHFDGHLPGYVEFQSKVVVIEGGTAEVIRPRSYCDLYRIERPESTAACGPP